ncbi:MAG TPA: SMP-30/gluconolactonase/LRE family protein, partial [Mycobacterium sp.]|nr:SMP-30/gluconolactonase/LRE family protein [Mycobacterium sp.]
MLLHEGRSGAGVSPTLAEGWHMERLTPPSRLFGANGLRTGPDGRIYIAQVTGSQISALDVGTGQLGTISPKGGDIIAPDDVAFGPRGDLYATEVMDGRVSVRGADGTTRVLRGDVPSANGITVHQGRLFIGECREGGRLLELDLAGGEPRVLLENVPSPNAMEVGPDGLLYFPVMGANEIWRIGLDGGAPETVASGLGVPDSVKFDAAGQIVSTQVHSGQVLRIDPRTGEQTVLAELNPGLDNLTFVDDRLFVSNFTGEITEILAGGQTQTVLPGGLNWPLDLAVGSDGNLYIADGTYFYLLLPDHTLQTVGMLFTPGYPGFVRGLAPAGPGEFVVTTSGGQVLRIDPRTGEQTVLADLNPGLDNLTFVDDRLFVSNFTGEITEVLAGGATQTALPGGLNWPLDLAVGSDGNLYIADGTYFYLLLPDHTLHTVGMLFTPGYPGFLRGLTPSGPGEFVVTTSGGQVSRYRPASGESEVLADGFDQLYGVAIAPDGTVAAAELGTGRVISIRSGRVETIASGLNDPIGVAIAPDGGWLVSEAGAGRVVKL